MKRIAVGYLRKSTNKQETSIEDQRNAILKYASDNDFKVAHWYIDEGISGVGVYGRKQFLKMIEDSKSKTFCAVLVWDIRRFSRGDCDEAGYFRYLLRQNGVDVVYITENLRGDDTDDLVIGTKQFLARQESKDKSKDTARGHVAKILQGHGNNGVPYAYDRLLLDKDGKIKGVYKKGDMAGRKAPSDISKLVLGDPVRVKAVKRMFDMYVNQGLGFRRVTRKLNEEGIPSPRGCGKWSGKWSMSVVENIIRNPQYTGKCVWNRRGQGKFHRIIREKDGYRLEEKGRGVKRTFEYYEEKNWYVYENAHKPIISQELFDRAQRVRKMRTHEKSFWGKGATSTCLLTGMIRCARCGRTLSKSSTQQLNKKYYYYVCEGCRTNKDPVSHKIPFEKIEGRILDRLNGDLFSEKEIKKIIAKVENIFHAEVEGDLSIAGGIDKKLKENENKIDMLLDTVDARHKDLINKKLDDLSKEQTDLKKQKEKLSASPSKIDVDKLASETMSYVKSFKKTLDRGVISEKKVVIRCTVHEIISDPIKKEAQITYYRIPQCPDADAMFVLSPISTYSGTSTKRLLT